ncbi:MAG: hypothetical protein G8345_18745 [Magnetococcales bacterium]|nr:hypothetical protein [Magnetococcales bacterium]
MKKSLQDQLVVEMDGIFYHLTRKSASPLHDPSALEGDKWLISDFKGGVPTFRKVDAPPAYAELVMQRRMRESGEITNDSKVLTHWKQSRGINASELFFTSVELAIFGSYEDRSHDDANHQLLFSSNAILYALLERFSKERTVMVIFEHNRHVDFIVGRDGRVAEANRNSTFSSDAEAKLSLVESFLEDLARLNAQTNLKVEHIVYFNWVVGKEKSVSTATPSFSPTFETFSNKTDTIGWGKAGHTETHGGSDLAQALPGWVLRMARELNVEYQILKPNYYDLEGDEYLLTSIPQAINFLHERHASNPPHALRHYRAGRWLPWLVIFSWGLIVSLYFADLWLQTFSGNMEASAMQMVEGVSTEKIHHPDPEFKKNLAFAGKLEKLKNQPSMQRIFSDITTAKQGTMTFHKLTIHYPPDGPPLIHVEGSITTPFQQAYVDQENFLATLRGKGYRIKNSQFNTNVESIRLSLDLERP